MNKDYSRAIPQEWHEMAKVYEALGDEHRQRILLTFEKDEELSIKDIVDVSTLRRTAVVHHLKKLQDANILTATKKGKFVFYKINPEIVKKTCENTIDYVNKHLI